MKLLELFCGTKSIGKEFAKAGFDVTSLDFDPQFNATITTDILTLPDTYFSGFDVVWASPPCEGFSVAVIGRNWHHDHTPKTDSARLGLALLEKTIAIIKAVDPKMFWIENPRGSRTGTQGMKSYKDKAVIPPALCRELAEFAADRLAGRVYAHEKKFVQGQLFT